MTTLPVPRPPCQPVHGGARWLVRPDAFGRGQLAIRTDRGIDRLYSTEALFGSAGQVFGWALTRLGTGETYHVNAETQLCDCADATYRQRRCKHILGLFGALAAVGWSADALSAPLTEEERQEAARVGRALERLDDPTERSCPDPWEAPF